MKLSNLVEQVSNSRDHSLEIHGWVYGIEDGLVKDLDVVFQGNNSINKIFRLD